MINFANHCRPQKFPISCGPIVLYPALGPFFAMYPAAISVLPSKCTLTGTFPAGIPAVPEFCCAKVCGQWLVLNVNVRKRPFPWCLTLSKEFYLRIGG